MFIERDHGSAIVEALFSLMLLSFALATIFQGERALLRYLPKETNAHTYRSAIAHARELIRAQLTLDPEATTIVLRPPMTPFESKAQCSRMAATTGQLKRCRTSIELPREAGETGLAEVDVWTP